jgi:hypothetical protein
MQYNLLTLVDTGRSIVPRLRNWNQNVRSSICQSIRRHITGSSKLPGLLNFLSLKTLFHLIFKCVYSTYNDKNLLVKLFVWGSRTPKNVVFWDIMPCGSCENRRFGGNPRFHHQGQKNQRAKINDRNCYLLLSFIPSSFILSTLMTGR